MYLISNYHTHTELCGHATGMSEEYVLEAINQGYLEIGFSDHGPIPPNFMSESEYKINQLDMQMDEKLYKGTYLTDIEKSINKYGKIIKIYKGLEVEYLSGHDDFYRNLYEELDYLSLGVHYFEDGIKTYNSYFLMDEYRINQYAETACKAMSTGYFKILNHPDLFLMNYINKKGNRNFDRSAKEASIVIIEAAIKYNVVLELNSGGVRKGKHKVGNLEEYLYPRSEFWKLVARYKEAKIIIGCDAHKPEELCDKAVIDTINFSKKYNLITLTSMKMKKTYEMLK